MRSRPQSVTGAAILLALFSVLWNLTFPLWAQAIPREEEIPVFIVYLTVVVGIAGLVGTAGLWMLRKWGLWFAIVVSVVNFLDGASGIVGAPYPALQVVSTVIVVVFALIIALVVLPPSRRALVVDEQDSAAERRGSAPRWDEETLSLSRRVYQELLRQGNPKYDR